MAMYDQSSMLISADRRAREAREEAHLYKVALEAIRDQDWVENCLDPQWSARIASAALSEKEN